MKLSERGGNPEERVFTENAGHVHAQLFLSSEARPGPCVYF